MVLQVIIRILKLHKIIANRQVQLKLFEPGCCIQQDQELIDLIVSNNYKQAVGVGAVNYFSKFIEFVDSGKVNFCIYIQLKPFDFDGLASDINHVIATRMLPGSLIYLSLNKYNAQPKRYNTNLSSDYDVAIEQFINDRVGATVKKYQPCGFDSGNKFNWVHPLTRFHLRVDV